MAGGGAVTTLQEKIVIMQACADGKTIQYKRLTNDPWLSITSPAWNWNEFEYRVKPAVPEYRLFMANNDRIVTTVQRNMLNCKGNTSVYFLDYYNNSVISGKGKWLTDWQPIPGL